MSISIIVLKEIGSFQYKNVLHSVQRAASLAGIHCIHVNTDFDESGGFAYLEGTLSEADAQTVKSNFEQGIHTRMCGFSIQPPTDASYDSFTWLIGKKNYFWALDLQYLSGDYAFAFQFLAQYFRLEENCRDYVWVDDTEWAYSADEMIGLSRQPYRPEWHNRKLTADNT